LPIKQYQMSKIHLSYYQQDDVVSLAKDLIGKQISSFIDGYLTAGLISETEAYAGIIDRASHAFGNRRTNRTETMYMEGGVAYVYLCYGIHSLFNIVTNKKDIPHAILIRGIIPIQGIDIMSKRCGRVIKSGLPINGPGKITRALGINLRHNEISLTGKEIWLDEGRKVKSEDILSLPRVGVDYAGEDALLPYRFLWEG